MRGTKFLPVEKLLEIKTKVMEKFSSNNNDLFLRQQNSELKKSEYYAHLSAEVYPEYKDRSWFKRFESGLLKAISSEAVFWSFPDLNQPALSKLYKYAYEIDLSDDVLKEIVLSFNNNRGLYLDTDFFKKLNFSSPGMEICHIAFDLSWLSNNIDSLISAIVKNKVIFRCILVSPGHRDLALINLKTKKVLDKGQFEVKIASDYFSLISRKGTVNTCGIFFPYFANTNLYRDIPDSTQNTLSIGSSLLTVCDRLKNQNSQRLRSDCIVDDKVKEEYTSIWFDEIWDQMKKIDL